MTSRSEPDSPFTGVLTGNIDLSDEQAFRSELFQYRYETTALLQKYLKVSLDLGRLPSVLGGEMFRSRFTAYRVTSFEDLVIFVTDMAACLNRLGAPARKFIALHIFQEFSKEEAAARMGFDVRHARRIYCDALDEMSEILLRFHLLDPSDWIGDEVASEGWFDGCPILRRRSSWEEADLPPKKPSIGVREAGQRHVLRMPFRAG